LAQSATRLTIGQFLPPSITTETESVIDNVHSRVNPDETTTSDSQTSPTSAAVTSKGQLSVSQYAYNDSVTKAEVLWALQTIAKYQSYGSCEDARDIFQTMFPYIQIAQKFTLGKTKIAYTVVQCARSAPYF